MRFLLLPLLALLAGCQSFVPQRFEDDRFVFDPATGEHWVKVHPGERMTRADLLAVEYEYMVAPYLGDDEVAALRRLRWAMYGDIATTAIGLGRGCRELNPLVRLGGNRAGMVAVAVVVNGVTYIYIRRKAAQSPRVASHAPMINAAAGIRAGVVGWNGVRIVRGCG